MKPIAVFFSLLLVSASYLFAHPTGHEGGFLETVKHFVSHPSHLLTWGAAFLFGAWLVWKAVRIRRDRAYQLSRAKSVRPGE